MQTLIIYNRALSVQAVHSEDKLAGRVASYITVRNAELWYAVRHKQPGCMLCVCVSVCRVQIGRQLSGEGAQLNGA
jgi:hypothetical protein